MAACTPLATLEHNLDIASEGAAAGDLAGSKIMLPVGSTVTKRTFGCIAGLVSPGQSAKPDDDSLLPRTSSRRWDKLHRDDPREAVKAEGAADVKKTGDDKLI